MLGGLVIPILCGATADWCGGAIGGSKGGRFCCKEAAKCSIQSHRTQKVALVSGTLYLQGPRAGQARLDPAIGVEDLPSTVLIKDILAMKKSSEVMTAYFNNMVNQVQDEFLGGQGGSNLSSPGSWTPIELADVEVMEEARRTMQSPSKLKMGPLLAEMAATAPMGGPKLEPSAPVPLDNTGKGTLDESSLGIILMGWNNLLENVGHLSDEMSVQNSSERQYREAVSTSLSKIQASVNLSDVKIQLLITRIGEVPKGEDVSVSLREAISHLQESNQDVIGEINKGRIGLVDHSSRISKSEDSLLTLSGNYKGLSKSYKTHIKALYGLIKGLTSELQSIKSGNGAKDENEFEDFMETSPGEEGISESFQELQEKVAHLSGATNQKVGRDQFDDLKRAVNKLEDKVKIGAGNAGTSSFYQLQLDQLLDKIMILEGRVIDESVKLDDFSFGSFSDFKSSFVEHEQVETAGWFWDIFSVLVVMKPKQLSGKDRADEQYSSLRVQSTPFENDLAASMTHEKPKLLYGSASHKDGFGNIPSYADWIGQGNESIKTRLNTYVRDYLEGVRGTISSSLKGGGLARALLMKVMSQWTSFTSHIDAFYQELVHVSHFSPKTAFTLIGRSSNAIWAAMRPYRTRVALLGNMTTSHNKASYIWGVLQCYRVMEEFIEVGFQGHPSFVKEMSLFMLTERVDPSQVRRIDETVSSLRANVDSTSKANRMLEEKYTALKRSYDNLTNEVRALATKSKAAAPATPVKKKKKYQNPEAKEAEGGDEE